MIDRRIFLAAVPVVMVALMIWDQIRLRQMRPHKWFVAALMLAIFELNVWFVVQP